MVETKCTERRIIINKFIKPKTLMGSSDERQSQRKVVRITYSDHNATDSSSGEEEGDRSRGVFKKTRVKRIVNEVRIVESDDSSARQLNSRVSGRSKKKRNGDFVKRNDGTGKNFKGVRQRQWGRWAAEIRNPFSKGRLWLGTYDTAEEAAMAYDKKSIELRGPAAFTNLIKPGLEPQKPLSPSSPPPPEVDIGTASCDVDEFVQMNNEPSKLDSGANFDYDSGIESQALHSPTSVLRFQPVEPGVEPTDALEWRPIEDFREEDGLVGENLSQFFSGLLDIESEFPLPTFYDEIRGPSENFSDIPLDFRSCTWDVDQYFQDQPLTL